MKLLFISLCFCLSLFCCSGQVIQIGGLAINVLRFGLDIVKFVKDKKLSRDNGIVDELKERISTTTSELKTSIGLSSRLGNIDDAVINIHSSMIDIVNIVESNTYTERNEYIRLFVYRFEQNGVIKHVRFLPELLTYTIPGVSGKLIDLVADNNRCNMTALDEFKKFYANLLSDGISLQLLFLHLNTELPLNKTINEWTEWLQQISHTFDSKKASCMKSFPKLAQEDVNNAVDAVRLWSDSKQRYPWKTSDVIFLKPYGTYQFIYHKSKEDHLFWKKSSERYKIAVFNDINKKVIVPEVLVAASETIKSSIEGETDNEAALHVGQAVEAHLKDQGLAINAIVVFFDGGDLAPEKIQIDEGKFCLLSCLTIVVTSYK